MSVILNRNFVLVKFPSVGKYNSICDVCREHHHIQAFLTGDNSGEKAGLWGVGVGCGGPGTDRDRIPPRISYKWG